MRVKDIFYLAGRKSFVLRILSMRGTVIPSQIMEELKKIVFETCHVE